ncbi:hypothetical protein CEP51_009675 [Fusarium floridanum]|uniref:Uncharacterized protein n=1 Tax=Fusarium floridanum TaxID=1325733 RepID=A0A428RGV0_9HYPO|nr:hypothetical protein CEP51_009675 [Fusarium floridanum]
MKFQAIVLFAAAPTKADASSHLEKRCAVFQEEEKIWHESGQSRRRIKFWNDGQTDINLMCTIWVRGKSKADQKARQNTNNLDDGTGRVDISTALGPLGDTAFRDAYNRQFKLWRRESGC